MQVKVNVTTSRLQSPQPNSETRDFGQVQASKTTSLVYSQGQLHREERRPGLAFTSIAPKTATAPGAYVFTVGRDRLFEASPFGPNGGPSFGLAQLPTEWLDQLARALAYLLSGELPYCTGKKLVLRDLVSLDRGLSKLVFGRKSMFSVRTPEKNTEVEPLACRPPEENLRSWLEDRTENPLPEVWRDVIEANLKLEKWPTLCEALGDVAVRCVRAALRAWSWDDTRNINLGATTRSQPRRCKKCGNVLSGES